MSETANGVVARHDRSCTPTQLPSCLDLLTVEGHTSRRVLAEEQPRSSLPVSRNASLRTSGCTSVVKLSHIRLGTTINIREEGTCSGSHADITKSPQELSEELCIGAVKIRATLPK